MRYLLPIVVLLSSIPALSQSWSYYGQDAGGKRYSALNQINTKNVDRLAVVWTFRTGELETYAGTGALDKAAFEATPILIGRTLFFSTPSDRVFAIDAASGQQQWVYDPHVDLPRDMSEISSRGVAAWSSATQAPAYAGNPDTLRIFIGTIDG